MHCPICSEEIFDDIFNHLRYGHEIDDSEQSVDDEKTVDSKRMLEVILETLSMMF